MMACVLIKQLAHRFDEVSGLAQAGQASVLCARSFKQGRQIVSWPLLGPEHKKQQLTVKKVWSALLTFKVSFRLTANPLRI
jgi:hypothetical protein